MKRILFCTVDSWCTDVATSSSNTYMKLFENYPAEYKAALFLREELPNSEACSTYFQISEQRVIKSIYSRVKTGRVLDSTYTPSETDLANIGSSKSLYRKNRARSPFMLLMRELVWFLGRWESQELDDFLDEYKPDVVIFSFEGYIHFNRICRYIVNHTKASAIGYIWDDTFTFKAIPKRFGYKILRFLQRRSILKTAKQCSAYWAISPKTKCEVDKFLNVNSIVVTKPIDEFNTDSDSTHITSPIQILYTGNLAIGRFDSLLQLSSILSILNHNQTRIEVHVYTSTYIDDSQRSQLHPDIHLYDPVSYEDVLSLQKKADILLYLESLSENEKNKARLSFSTKITDYLGAGKPIVAIGPSDISSMEYFQTEDAAMCASSREELLILFNRILSDYGLLEEYRQKSLSCGLRNHSRSVIQSKVENCLNSL